MPRDNDKHNDSPRGRRERPEGGRGRTGKPRGPEKKFAKRGFGPKRGESDGERPRFRNEREERPIRRRDGEEGPRRFERGERGPKRFDRDDRPPRRDRDDRPPRRDSDEARPAGRFQDRKFGDRKGAPGDRKGAPGDRKSDLGDRKGAPGDRKSDPGDRKSDPGDRKGAGDRDQGGFKGRLDDRPFKGRREDRDFKPRREGRDFSRDRSDEKPWQKREDRGGSDRPRFPRSRDDRGGDERPRFSRSREDRPKFERGREDRPKFDRPREDRPKFSRPRRDRNGEHGERDGDRETDHRHDRRPRPEGRRDWQEHPRSEGRFSDRPRRDNEDDSRIFSKRPAFGGRGAYRERPDFEKRARPDPKPKKAGERIAKVLARAGLASRRDAEEMVTQGRVSVNGRVINSPALDVTTNDVVAVDGKPLPPRERTRLFLYHKPKSLMTTHADPEGRPTVFDNLPEGLPRLISIGRLDFNTEGLLLLTNDGGLARVLELPDTGWLRRYRVRAHGEITQQQLDELKNGIEVDGVKYGPIDATLERDQGANVWLVFAIREGKNREVRNVMAHLGLEVNRLIRISYGPFQLGEIEEGKVEEVKTRVLREQLGEKVIAQAGCQFDHPGQRGERDDDDAALRGKKQFKPAGKSALVNDRKGRRVLVQRTGSAEARARNEEENSGYSPPRRPKRGYHGKRDLKPRDE
jgi:23S rRNA pseudouridine2605 synthase